MRTYRKHRLLFLFLLTQAVSLNNTYVKKKKKHTTKLRFSLSFYLQICFYLHLSTGSQCFLSLWLLILGAVVGVSLWDNWSSRCQGGCAVAADVVRGWFCWSWRGHWLLYMVDACFYCISWWKMSTAHSG